MEHAMLWHNISAPGGGRGPWRYPRRFTLAPPSVDVTGSIVVVIHIDIKVSKLPCRHACRQQPWPPCRANRPKMRCAPGDSNVSLPGQIVRRFKPCIQMPGSSQSCRNAYYPPHTHQGLTTHLILDGQLTITFPKDSEPKKESFGPGARGVLR